MSRRVGLTANAPSLLKTVGNRPRQAPKALVADDAPPLSTDDEEDTFSEGTVQAAKASDRTASPKRNVSTRPRSPPDSDLDSSADERSRRAAIKPTAFASKKQQGSETLKKRRRISKSPQRERPKATNKLKPGNHLTEKFGFTGPRQNKSTYGKQARSSQSSQPGSSQGSNRLRVSSSIETPQKKRSSKLIVPAKNILSSPRGSPMKLLTDLNGNADSEDDDSLLESLKSKEGARKSTKKGKKQPSPSSSPPRAVFKMPEDFLDKSPGKERPIGDAVDLSRLSSDEESQDDGGRARFKMPEELPAPSPGAKCPWCGEAVEQAFLDDFSRGQRLPVRMQTRFCQLHKQRAAAQTWRDLGYPEIDWDGVEALFAAHRGHLRAVVDGRAASHFYDAHARNVAEGRARAMKREENLNPGYYGPRGLCAMGDYLVREFGDVLKKRAVDDRVIAGRGSAAFIQAVLVPELGVRLIMDDLKLSELEARQVLEESKALGELVQPEVER